jgi:hypothetical protein
MFTGITGHSGALITAIVVLTGAAILGGGAAAADPNQDDQFLTLLDKQDIPALKNAPSLIATAHRVCLKLDGGMPMDNLVDLMINNAYNQDPIARLYPRARVASTITRFIAAAVEAYCPYDQSKIASSMANPAPGPNEPTHRVAAYTHNAVNSGSDLWGPPPALDIINIPAPWQEPTGTGAVRLAYLMDGGGVFVAGGYRDDRSDCDTHGTVLASLIGAVPSDEVTPPPQIPAPPPPASQIRTPPRPITAPPPPKQPPPPPQQVEPPAVAPQPGGAAGSGGSGSNGGDGTGGNGTGGKGGGGPAKPSPTPHMPPGVVRLAP